MRYGLESVLWFVIKCKWATYVIQHGMVWPKLQLNQDTSLDSLQQIGGLNDFRYIWILVEIVGAWSWDVF